MNVLYNPNNSIPADLDEPLRAYTEARQTVLAREYRIAELARPTMKDREVRRDVLIGSHPEYQVQSDTSERMSHLRDQKFEHLVSGVRETLSDHIDIAIKYPSLILAPPAPVDSTFWWAHERTGRSRNTCGPIRRTMDFISQEDPRITTGISSTRASARPRNLDSPRSGFHLPHQDAGSPRRTSSCSAVCSATPATMISSPVISGRNAGCTGGRRFSSSSSAWEVRCRLWLAMPRSTRY